MDDGDADLSEEEVALRMNNAVRRALNTPPKSRKPNSKASEKAQVPKRLPKKDRDK
jgi:hypothetical protein